MTALQLRKKTLLLESDLNRLTLHAECAHLRKAANLTERLKNARRQIAPWALVLAPLTGVVLALGQRRSSTGIGLWTRALQVTPLLIQIWRALSSPSKEQN